MTKRLLNYVGFALLALPLLAAVVIQLWSGNVVSFGTPQVISENRSEHLIVIVNTVDVAFHWKTIIPLLAVFAIGVVCLIIANKKPKDEA